MTFLQTKIAILCILFFYLSTGLLMTYTTVIKQNSPSLFPLFSWAIFTEIIRPTEEYATIRILSYDGRDLSPPLYFNDALGLFDTKFTSPQSWYVLFNDLCGNIQAQNQKNIFSLREKIETILIPRDVIYEVVTIKINPLDFYKSRTVINITSCGGIMRKGDFSE